MATLLERLVGGPQSLAGPDWKKPQHILDAIAARKKKRPSQKKSLRSSDCGRDEGGRFGSGNDCASEDGSSAGTATTSPTSSSGTWSSNESATWPATSRDSSPPPIGDGRYGSIDISSPKTVKSSLDAAGIDPKLAPMVAGGSEESDVFVRPAPDFSMEFPGSKVTPVMFAFEKDFAGVDGGLHGSSVIGVTAAGETVVYHSTVNVSDSIKQDDAKRHAAAREFYRAMVSSVESARKAGVSRIVLNAAGNSSATKGSLTSTPWRGYTIWPRMGFDAPLPASIKAKLPPDLSHAKSLLDLHATPEGTRWWRDNGEDLDVTFDLADRSSPQSKIMDRFIKKFGTDRREMPLGSGDEWLSPEDLVRLDEMWEEIWDDGELDEYEWVERRSGDCGRDDDGRFGPRNDCASDDVAAVSDAPKSGATKPDKWGEYFSEDSPPERPRVYGENGKEAKGAVVPEAIQKRYEEAVSRWAYGIGVRFNRGLYANEGSRTVDAAEALVRGLSFAASVGDRIPAEVAIGSMTSGTALAEYSSATDRIIINRKLDAASVESAMQSGWLSGDPSRPLESLFAHELSHSLHYESMNLNAERWEAMTGLPEINRLREEASAAGRQFRPAAGLLESFAWSPKHRISSTAGPLTPDQAMSVAKEVSGYAASNPIEFVAEFRTGVLMGRQFSDAAWSLYDDYGGPKIMRRPK